jgi:hypothetical protein
MAIRYATPENVALGWVAGLPGLSAAMVGDTLPTDNTSWAASGFITAVVSGGGANIYYRLDEPVVTLQCWACQPGTSFVPWPKARNIAETIRVATYLNQPRTVSPPLCDETAKVLSSYTLGQPRKVFGDLGEYAAFSVDVQLFWVAAAKP